MIFRMEKFQTHINNIILYAKGWYKVIDTNKKWNKEEKLIFDCQKILELDGYSYIKNVNDIIKMLLIEFDRFNEWKLKNNLNYIDHYHLYIKIHDYMILTQTSYDYALLKTILDEFMYIKGEYISLKRPIKFNRAFFKKGIAANTLFGNLKHGTTYKQQNAIIDKIFNN